MSWTYDYRLTSYGRSVLERYRHCAPWFSTIIIPFDTFSTANQQLPPLIMDECTDDLLLVECTLNFQNDATVLVQDNDQYVWCQSNRPAMLAAVAGTTNQVAALRPLPIEYFLRANNKLLWTFRNGPTPQTVDRMLTIRGFRLKDKK